MNYSKQELAEIALRTNFIKDNIEKVLRLSEILKYINNDEYLKTRLALKGGTSINLSVVSLPRLSVDIDFDLTENVSKEELQQLRDTISTRIINYMLSEGYTLLEAERNRYALISHIFYYVNNAGNRDSIKIEINVMDRCHIMPTQTRIVKTRGIIDEFSITTLNEIELYASKINALLSRCTPRDLYDVNTMVENDIIQDKELLKKCTIFYNVIGGEMDIDDINYSKIDGMNYLIFKKQLKPLIAKNDSFILDVAKERVTSFLKELIVLSQNEKKFLFEFKNGKYIPELLFDDNAIIKRIKYHPMAMWKLMNK